MLRLRYAPLSMTILWGRLVGVRHVYQTYRLIDPATINELSQKDVVDVVFGDDPVAVPFDCAQSLS